MPAQRINEILAGRRAITADTDLGLCRFFGLSNGYWLRAQAAYDTEVAEDLLSDALLKIKPRQHPFPVPRSTSHPAPSPVPRRGRGPSQPSHRPSQTGTARA